MSGMFARLLAEIQYRAALKVNLSMICFRLTRRYRRSGRHVLF
jgi:hypothetical protein